MKPSRISPVLHRVLMAYRPLHLRGLLVDGQYRMPPRDATGAVSGGSRQRMLLVALARVHQQLFHSGSRP